MCSRGLGRDARGEGLSVRALAARHGVHFAAAGQYPDRTGTSVQNDPRRPARFSRKPIPHRTTPPTRMQTPKTRVSEVMGLPIPRPKNSREVPQVLQLPRQVSPEAALHRLN